MNTQESLSLLSRFEATHTPFPDSCRLMRKLCSIVGILGGIVNRIRYQCAMGDTIASQLVRYDPPWLAATPFDQTPEEALCRFPVSPRLQKHIHNFTILISIRSIKGMLWAYCHL